MIISPEELAAFADGELSGVRRDEIAATVAADPELAGKVAAHRKLKSMLGAHFSPISQEPVPDRLVAMLQKDDAVVDFDGAREKRDMRNPSSRRGWNWGWVAGPALAASLAVAVFMPRGGESGPEFADTQLAAVLDNQMVASQANGAQTRILLSFRDQTGQFCRAYSGADAGGIACKGESGWRLRDSNDGAETAGTEYRQAGAGQAALLAAAQELAAGPALDSDEEATAKRRGWR